ncbi:hypothetical protein Ait01nite_020200 [Actinoplanes italicus]|uniref:Uncharacterized protein n=1 Tax=Actinoplanes italicus TaxID=113567 RepID=A0A2T0KPA9_9ACTN|nr:hypothetical protein [Actinoplanes italicus]PRX25581.1 hypothetical protein CLV67_101298 [Actinoplanes italicus]GIE28975.1 hypothetical protein Ait01nite_020200 [Actinoplanes italicus]
MENMERSATLVVTSEHRVRMATLVDSMASYGEVVGVDDQLERITLEMVGIRLGFVVVGGNNFVVPTVMLLSINDQIVLADETAGLWEVHPRIAERIADLFSRYGSCVRCAAGDHGTCLRQHMQQPCRCECGLDWALHRSRQSLGRSPSIEPDPAVAALTGDAAAVELEPLPVRDAPTTA